MAEVVDPPFHYLLVVEVVGEDHLVVPNRLMAEAEVVEVVDPTIHYLAVVDGVGEMEIVKFHLVAKLQPNHQLKFVLHLVRHRSIALIRLSRTEPLLAMEIHSHMQIIDHPLQINSKFLSRSTHSLVQVQTLFCRREGQRQDKPEGREKTLKM